MKTRYGFIPAIAAVALLGAGTAYAAPKLRVGAASNTGGMIVFVAVDKGIFAKNGIDAKVVVRNSGPQLTKSLKAGEIDFAPAAFTNLPAALERGLDLRGVVGYVGASYAKSTSDRSMGIALRPESKIKSIADLKGKKVGVTFGGTGDAYLREVLRRAKIKPTQIKRVNVRPPSIVSLFASGGVEAMVAWEPNFTRISDKVKGSRELVRGGEYVCFCAVLHGNPGTVYKDKAVTQKFVDAISEAAAYLRDPKNLDEVSKIGARYVRGMDAALIKRVLKYSDYDPRLGKNTVKTFNFSVEQLIAQKKMKKPYDSSKYLDMTFISSTMKRHPEWFKDLPSGS